MLVKTPDLSIEVPQRNTFLGKVKFWFLVIELESIAQEHGLILDQEFYEELNQWTGKCAMITFSRKTGESPKYKVETVHDHFERVLARIKDSGIASGYL
jgi:hypothetical protein